MSERTVLITGGTNGIGLATAKHFAEQGDHVIVWGLNEERIAAVGQSSPNIEAHRVDVSQDDVVQEAVRQLLSRHRVVDVLVNAAGATDLVPTTMEHRRALAIWKRMLAVNLDSVFYVTYALAGHIRRPGGRIINISSMGAFTGSALPGNGAYAAAKAGVNALTLALSNELAPDGITVNAVTPGFIADTGITESWPAEQVGTLVERAPVKRAGTPDDVASAIVYLASDSASFMTGQFLNVTGGSLPGR